MGNDKGLKVSDSAFPMIPPQVNGATEYLDIVELDEVVNMFPMIPPQVNGATDAILYTSLYCCSEMVVSNDSAPS